MRSKRGWAVSSPSGSLLFLLKFEKRGSFKGQSTVGFGFSDFFDVEAPFFAVNSDDLSLFLFVGASDNDDFVVFSDWHASDSVFLSEVLGKRSAHQGVSNMGRSLEVGPSLDSSGA